MSQYSRVVLSFIINLVSLCSELNHAGSHGSLVAKPDIF